MAESKVQYGWKRRPSEIRGYERAIYTTMSNGDYLRVDYNKGDERVRIYVEVQGEDGASYYSVISQGLVTVERNSSGRSARVADNIRKRAEEFSSIPNEDVLGLLNGNYGIAQNQKAQKEKIQKRKAEFEETKRKYFKRGDVSGRNPYTSAEGGAGYKKIGFIDLLDSLAGAGLAVLFFWLNQYSFLAAGATCAIWGLLIGLFDMIIRDREPFFLKIFLFLISGAALYVYGYFFV